MLVGTNNRLSRFFQKFINFLLDKFFWTTYFQLAVTDPYPHCDCRLTLFGHVSIPLTINPRHL